MDLSTTYLGLQLPHPLMPGASPLTADLDAVKRLEDAGAAAIVMNSLFEEQFTREALAAQEAMETPAESFAEALSYFPRSDEFRLGPDEYFDRLRRIKETVGIPVIASLNGVTSGGWVRCAQQIVAAGADALELNVYYLATDPRESGAALEQKTVALLRAVKQVVAIPVAVKLSPFYSSLPHMARQLEEAGADGLVLFNRFYQPDIDIEELEAKRALELSTSAELLLRLRFLAILSGRGHASLAVTGGVHTAADAVKAIMAGAHAVQMVSALLQRGPAYLRQVCREVETWLERRGYASLAQMRGSMDLSRSPDPGAYERANYEHILQGWRPE
ncbi:MAG: dihydroorotate dehydrogenase-like protein [Candidatus Eisenbacteria bacterium]|uniref:Dihydroorotate dehydrogenase-like protein n=1 Tax=Eiseniibacteriota bacterium TaxID=2212470 RepID=A0A938BR76_UNCEI|nr:dihydroorotate dehydrogenase-like protein [Candidatus Eisenbacteria bacterium]